MDFEEFRSYLHVLAETQLSPALRCKVDASDIVQQTMLQAHQARALFRGSTQAEMAAWLRQILANVLNRLVRDYSRDKRAIDREQSLYQAINDSSMMLANIIAGDDSSPSHRMQEQELAMLVATAIMKLTEEQRRAIVLKYWNGMTLAEIGKELGKSVEAVAGLLFRGTQALRSELKLVN